MYADVYFQNVCLATGIKFAHEVSQKSIEAFIYKSFNIVIHKKMIVRYSINEDIDSKRGELKNNCLKIFITKNQPSLSDYFLNFMHIFYLGTLVGVGHYLVHGILRYRYLDITKLATKPRR